MPKLQPVSLALVLALASPLVLAQESVVTEEEPAAAEPAAEAQPSGDPELTQLMQDVSAIAEQLQADVASLEESIQASHNSAAAGAEVLDAMLASVQQVNASIAEESNVWSELETLLARWEDNRRSALERSETNPAFADIAEQWKTRLERARALQEEILIQRANSESLRRAIESDREVVLAYYELGQADQAIAGLQKVSESLQSLNDSMQGIVETVNIVSAPAIAN